MKHFSEILTDEEFFRELNAKAVYLKQAEVLRRADNVKYSELLRKYNAEYQQLHLLPLRELKLLVEEIR